MFSHKVTFYLHYYFTTLCFPAIIITLFVLYVYLKGKNKRF